MDQRTPTALTIAGSDPSGGAGIQADLKTFAACGAYGASVIVALTAQNTLGVTGIHAVPPEFVVKQLNAVFDDQHVPAAKTGMLANRATIEAVLEGLPERAGADGAQSRSRRPFLVVDPVMVATSGDPLLEPDAESAVRDLMLPQADLVTPNLHEAARLLRAPVARTVEEATAQARALKALGPSSVLLKGGHLVGAPASQHARDGNGSTVVVELPQALRGRGAPGDGADVQEDAQDVLIDADGTLTVLTAGRIATRNTHGTGCTLSAAIVGQLAHGQSLRDAVIWAKRFVSIGLALGCTLRIGAGSGPLDHAGAARCLLAERGSGRDGAGRNFD